MNDIARVKEILAAISMRDQFVMSFFHWLSRPKTNLSPQQKFAADMRETLLSTAKAILSKDSDPLMRVVTFQVSFGSIIASVREIYGPHIVDENSLAMQMVAGFGEGGEAHRAAINKLDWFMSKLREAKGNDEATLVLMAHMLNAHDWQGIIDGRILTQSSTMKAPVEVDQMGRLRQAIATISPKPLADKDPTATAATAAAVLTTALVDATKSAIEDDDDRFAAGIFALVFASYFAPNIEGDSDIAAPFALFQVSYRFWGIAEVGDASRGGQWANRILEAYNHMVQSKAKVIYDIGESCEAWFKNPAPLQFERLAELFRRFREDRSHPDAHRIEAVLKLIGQADDESKFKTAHRLGEAARTVKSECSSAEMSFAEFKALLGRDEATAVAAKTREIGKEVQKREVEFEKRGVAADLVATAFMLVAASLYARGGAEWVSRQTEGLIDDLIASGEKLLKLDPESSEKG